MSAIRVSRWVPKAEAFLLARRDAVKWLEAQLKEARREETYAWRSVENARTHDSDATCKLRTLHLIWRSGWPAGLDGDVCELILRHTSCRHLRMLSVSCHRLCEAVEAARPIRLVRGGAEISVSGCQLLITTGSGELHGADGPLIKHVTAAAATQDGYMAVVGGLVYDYDPHPGPVTTEDGQPLGKVVSIASGSAHQIAALEGGEVLTWGGDDPRPLGRPVRFAIPTQVATLRQVVGVAAGGHQSAAWTRDGQLFTWGCRRSQGHAEAGPAVVSGPSNVTRAAVGERVMVAMSDEGRVWWWGAEIGEALDVSRPVAMPDVRAQDVAAGSRNVVCATLDDKLLEWGQIDHAFVPSPTTKHSGVVRVAACGDRLACLTVRGEVLLRQRMRWNLFASVAAFP